jgi:hypothetical protein
VLIGSEVACKQALTVWLFGMFVHDVDKRCISVGSSFLVRLPGAADHPKLRVP